MLATLLPDYRTLERIALPFYGAWSWRCWSRCCVIGPDRQRLAALARPRAAATCSRRELAKLAMIILFARLLARRSASAPVGLLDLIVPGAPDRGFPRR